MRKLLMHRISVYDSEIISNQEIHSSHPKGNSSEKSSWTNPISMELSPIDVIYVIYLFDVTCSPIRQSMQTWLAKLILFQTRYILFFFSWNVNLKLNMKHPDRSSLRQSPRGNTLPQLFFRFLNQLSLPALVFSTNTTIVSMDRSIHNFQLRKMQRYLGRIETAFERETSKVLPCSFHAKN